MPIPCADQTAGIATVTFSSLVARQSGARYYCDATDVLRWCIWKRRPLLNDAMRLATGMPYGYILSTMSADSIDLFCLKAFWKLFHEQDRLLFLHAIAQQCTEVPSDSERLASMKRKWRRLTEREKQSLLAWIDARSQENGN